MGMKITKLTRFHKPTQEYKFLVPNPNHEIRKTKTIM
jgi:hypothetical protein